MMVKRRVWCLILGLSMVLSLFGGFTMTLAEGDTATVISPTTLSVTFDEAGVNSFADLTSKFGFGTTGGVKEIVDAPNSATRGKALKFKHDGTDGTGYDAVYIPLGGGATKGSYKISYDMYEVKATKDDHASYTYQEVYVDLPVDPAIWYNGGQNLFANDRGVHSMTATTGGMKEGDQRTSIGTAGAYTYGKWRTIEHIVDMDSHTVKTTIKNDNGTTYGTATADFMTSTWDGGAELTAINGLSFTVTFGETIYLDNLQMSPYVKEKEKPVSVDFEEESAFADLTEKYGFGSSGSVDLSIVNAPGSTKRGKALKYVNTSDTYAVVYLPYGENVLKKGTFLISYDMYEEDVAVAGTYSDLKKMLVDLPNNLSTVGYGGQNLFANDRQQTPYTATSGGMKEGGKRTVIGTEGNYPYGRWRTIEHTVDLDHQTVQTTIKNDDGTVYGSTTVDFMTSDWDGGAKLNGMKGISFITNYHEVAYIDNIKIEQYTEQVLAASAVFGETNTYKDMTVQTENMTPETKGGRTAYMLDATKATSTYMPILINDTAAYDIEDGLPVDISIDYYDEGTGFFEITYDGHHPKDDFLGSVNVTTGELVQLTNTKQWKTKTVRVTDLKLANRIDNYMDIRLGAFSFGRNASSPSPVAIGAIYVHSDPMDITGRSASQPGNVFAKDEDISFTLSYKNRYEEEVKTKFYAEVYRGDAKSADETLLWSGEVGEATFASKGTGSHTFSIPSSVMDRYGFYHIILRKESALTGLGDTKLKTADKIEFSCAWKNDPTNRNDKFGTHVMSASYHWGETGVSDVQAQDAGFGWLREQLDWGAVEYPKGTYTLPEAHKKAFADAKKMGFKLQIGAQYANALYGFLNKETGVNEWAVMPESDEEIEAYAKYCEWLVTELKDVIGAIGIWNEPNITGFNVNNAPPATYVKILKTVYPRIKKINPDVLVVGPDLAGGLHQGDTRWLEEVLKQGGGEYLDVISVHPYHWGVTLEPKEMIRAAEYLRSLLDKYGLEDKQLWNSESGFTRVESQSIAQAEEISMYYAIFHAYDLYDKWFQFRFNDGGVNDVTSGEAHFGLTYDPQLKDEPLRPAGARPSYLAVCTVNQLIGDKAVLEQDLSSGDSYIFKFYHPGREEAVLYMQSEIGKSSTLSVDLGVNEVSVYDIYGNETKMQSATGFYTFGITESPQYVCGNFQEFVPWNCFRDESSKKVRTLTAGQKIRATVDEDFTVAEGEEAVCYIAFYDENGILISTKSEKLNQANGQQWVSAEVTVPTGAKDVKAFFWDSKTLKAYIPALTL